ncbi:AT-rich interactive domain-containing protein 4A isoform X1 [Megalops cyprinoides]|uniref:AT-rich interactive domain-containing protein 4A isoform X1 n=1 Tax=Megalops cyprinoides TaxID=118141 RepID=UPI001864029F|nr:AT-rich interactive domain-containing protein 4A isoform X1 [Megalops cyprinoides]
MKAADEPAYLTVGTDVSAKYRGAFCEAKIKTVKRMVKVKVVLKGDSTSQVVQDDQVKGPLRVGSTVEVKSAEGGLSQAVISKLTDASWYTVVFDDGDEKTLRRTSLCLKGERHFAESETLDQLPLTNPEHFGTPVIGKKTNRGRRSSLPVAEDEKESSSSEEEDEDKRRLNDELLGKVVCIQTGPDRTCWYLALVISPSCNDDLIVKKDQCLVRSFADSRFYIVARKEVHQLDVDSISKPEYASKKGFDGALLFLKDRVVPDTWKMDMSEILESSSSDEEDAEGKDSEEDEKEVEEEEPEMELDPEEKDHFLQQLYKFMEDRGTPINKPPVLGYKDLNLFKLFRLVYHQGGCDNIESGAIWKQIYMDLGIPVLNSAASYNVKTAYRKYLYGFEEYCRSASIQFRTIHHNNPRPPSQAEPKAEPHHQKEGPAAEREAELAQGEEKPPVEEDESSSESEKEGRREVRSPRVGRRAAVTPVKSEAKEPVVKVKEEKAKMEETGGEEQKDLSGGDTPGKRAKLERRRRGLEESEKESEEEDEDEEEEEETPRPRERDERETVGDADEDSEHTLMGTKVKVKYGRGKTQKIYEANIKNTETDDGEVLYLVHYYGWNVRYDEWVKADRIIWPVDKGSTRRKLKKKLKNKDEVEREEKGEKEEERQVKSVAKRGRPPLKSTPPSVSRAAPKTPSSEGRAGGKGGRPSDGLLLPNGEAGTPRRRTRRTSGMYDSDRGSNESGNSSEESESEDSPEKRSGRVETTDPATARKQEEEEEQQAEDGKGEEQGAEKGGSEVQEVQEEPVHVSSPREHQAEQHELQEEEQRLKEAEQPEEEAAPVAASETQMEPKEEDRPTRPKGRRSRQKDPVPETATKAPPTSSHGEEEAPHTPSPKKPEERSESPHHHSSNPQPDDSDTDSATEEICREDRKPAKRKAMEQCTPEKKVRCPERREEPSAMSPEKRVEPGHKGVEWPSPAKEAEPRAEMPALTLEVRCKGEGPLGAEPQSKEAVLSAEDELIPPIGPDALVCHEVDLDDLDEKDKATGEELLVMMRGEENVRPLPPSHLHHHHHHHHHSTSPGASLPTFSPAPAHSPGESHSTRSESDVTIEVDSVAGESQEGLCESESANGFDASTSSSNSSISLQDREAKDRGQKRSMDGSAGSIAKKQKRSQKRTSAASKTEKNGTGHSSDSEDLPVTDTSSKLTPVKHSAATKKLARSPGGGMSPNSKEGEKDKHRDKPAFPSPRTYKWTFQLTELDNMTSAERIAFLQNKLQEIRKYYMSLKSEVASIDRRRKRLKKKEREVSHTLASTSSGSSDTAMSPSSASPTQNTVAVECR